MFDDSVHLRENPHMLALFSHYARLGSEDQAIWQNRLMEMEGVAPKELSVLHGELIALDWIEQNSCNAVFLKDGTLGSCYRITMGGLREYRRFQGLGQETDDSEFAESSKPIFARKKRAKPGSKTAAAATE